MMHRAKRLTQIALAILLLYWLAIFTTTHLPQFSQQGQGHLDKVYHFCAYGGLSFLVCLAWNARRRLRLRHFVVVLLVLAAYGAFDELSQIPVGRSCDIDDWYADMLGALAGIVAFGVLRRMLEKSPSRSAQ